MIHIKPATVYDWQLIQEMGRTTFYDTFAADNTEADMQQFLATQYNDDAVQRELVDAQASFYIAYVDEKDAGYAKLGWRSKPDCVTGEAPIEIERIYVRKNFLGDKVGAALMQHCLDEARRRGCDTIWLGVWEHNRRAITFYERWGFVQCGAKKFVLGSDEQTDYIMQRKITDS
jgi:GNAT superfamily N-acetyltransferase